MEDFKDLILKVNFSNAKVQNLDFWAEFQKCKSLKFRFINLFSKCTS